MIAVVPYPDGIEFLPPDSEDDAREFACEIVSWANKCLIGIWELDMLREGVRIRYGNERDSIMIAMKFGVKQ
tara:strand:+ start:2166 stop:2381 length:216 start_codon:yes stop_codon:yes gene_type:complete